MSHLTPRPESGWMSEGESVCVRESEGRRTEGVCEGGCERLREKEGGSKGCTDTKQSPTLTLTHTHIHTHSHSHNTMYLKEMA